MITQLATVAIRASVRVSPATVPPKLVIRSKSRSRLLASDSASLPSWAWATSGSRSVRSTRSGRGRGRRPAVAAALTISNRVRRVGDAGGFEDLGELGRDDLGRGLGAVEGRGVEVQRILAAAGERRRERGAGLGGRRPPGAPAIGFASPTVISTRGQAGPNASRILSLTCVGVLVGRADVEPRQRLVLGRPGGSRRSRRAGRSAFCRTNSARCDSESDWTVGSASLSRMVTSVPPVKSMLYIVRPRAKKATRPSRIRISEPAMQ